MDRVAWESLPGSLKAAIEARTGPITSVRTATAGENSPLAAVITTSGGKQFAKGMPSDHRRVVSQAREVAVARFVTEVSPRLLWHFDEAGWTVLGYEHVAGRHADYRPGSLDLDRMVRLLDTLGQVKVLDPGPFKYAEDRWRSYVDDPREAQIFAGSTLTHSDLMPDNVLVEPGGRAWLIDWAWPTLGAAWTDPACWVLRLMCFGGHTADQAEQQASRLRAFATADPAHIDTFAVASTRLWAEVAKSNNSQWTQEMARTAHAWVEHRRVGPRVGLF